MWFLGILCAWNFFFAIMDIVAGQGIWWRVFMTASTVLFGLVILLYEVKQMMEKMRKEIAEEIAVQIKKSQEVHN